MPHSFDPVECPALLISAMASGQGKTLITAALARLHTRQGRVVRVFKCGPDYLDPYWHELASGAPVQNIDLWMTGEADLRQRLHAAALEADLILIEGVMGLFDGKTSAADMARLLNVPVMPVIQVGAMAQSIGAVAYGLKHYQPDLPWAGVLGNGVASARHAQMLQQAFVAPEDWLGAMPKLMFAAENPALNFPADTILPARHLGLVAAHELHDAVQRLDYAADALEQTALGQMSWQDWQKWSVRFVAPETRCSRETATESSARLLDGRRIAVAKDAAFSFIYPANVQLLRELGADVCFFSPLAGDRLPDCDAIWLPGGYPELHASAIASNTGLRHDLLMHLNAKKPIWAECGGMVALCESVVQTDGREQALWGLLPGQAHMQKRLAGLGMQQMKWQGHTMRGHTFHYSKLHTTAEIVNTTSRPDPLNLDQSGENVYQHGTLHASYFHAWFPSAPELIAALLND